MAASNLNLGKASGGVLNIQPADGTTNTSIVLPASGTVTTNEYVNSNNLGNGSTTFNGFGGTGFKNYIINGNFDIWQRGNGPFTNWNIGADRWIVYNTTATMVSSSTSTNGIQKHIAHIQNVTAGNQFLGQAIELPLAGFGHPFVVGKKFTLSVRYSSTTKIRPLLIFRDSGAGANPVYLDSSMTTPVYKGGSGVDEIVSWTFTVNGTAASTNTCLVLSLESESNASNVYMYQVQLEQGSVATPFEQRPYGLELALCQRYFYRLPLKPSAFNDGYNGAQGYIVQTCPIPVTMRTTPTVTAPGSSGFTQTNVLSQEFYAMNENSLIWLLRATAAGRLYSYPTTTTQNVDCSSEL